MVFSEQYLDLHLIVSWPGDRAMARAGDRWRLVRLEGGGNWPPKRASMRQDARVTATDSHWPVTRT